MSATLLETSPLTCATRALLGGALARGGLGHAYLLVGSQPAALRDAAWALAQGALCAEGTCCAACEECELVARHVHPDVHVLAPQGTSGYLVGQIRELIEDVSMAPMRGRGKVIVVQDVDRLADSSANALLKTLEEPPGNTMFVLTCPSRDAVLTTIVSRCQVMAIEADHATNSAEELAGATGKSLAAARKALACCTSPAQAQAFLESPERQAVRTRALECLARLPGGDELDVLRASRALTQALAATVEPFEERRRSELEERYAFSGAVGQKDLEETLKREMGAQGRLAVMEAIAAQRSLLRDALMVAAGTGADIVCDDFAPTVEAFATRLGLGRLPRALDVVARTCGLIARNTTHQLAMEAMLFEIKEMFSCQP